MKINLRKFMAVALLSFGAMSINAQSQATDTINLTLDECLSIALSENPTIKVADMEIERVNYSKKEAISQLTPDISMTGSYSRTIKKQTMTMNGQSFQVGSDNSYSAGFSASMPLISVQLWKSIKLSNTQILINLEKARESRLSLINQVENAYFGLLYAQDALKVLVQNKERA